MVKLWRYVKLQFAVWRLRRTAKKLSRSYCKGLKILSRTMERRTDRWS